MVKICFSRKHDNVELLGPTKPTEIERDNE